MDKRDVRKAVRAGRRNRPEAALRDGGAALARYAWQLPGRRIAAFAGAGGEPPTLPLLDALRRDGRDLLLPVLLDDMDLDWARYEGRDALVVGRMGIAQPAGSALGRDAIESVETGEQDGLALPLCAIRDFGVAGGAARSAQPDDEIQLGTTASSEYAVGDPSARARAPRADPAAGRRTRASRRRRLDARSPHSGRGCDWR